ncbi:jg461 [Pararge aegeria aegeria]|uniref:Jg461 protein n=1 Tax=Pararge aegeria aegeria TaxID=348720 RepID=A0A8S4RR28_9NEOP|nr:jg461 [Pararge aegeria aegeria]
MLEKSTMAVCPEINVSMTRESPEINVSTMRESQEIKVSAILESPGNNGSPMRDSPEINLSRIRETPEINVSTIRETPEMNVTMVENPDNDVGAMEEYLPIPPRRSRRRKEYSPSEYSDISGDEIPIPPQRFKRKFVMDIPTDVWGQLALEASQVYLTEGGQIRSPFANTTIEKLPDKVLLNIFSYLSHREICRMATVCKRWRMVAYDTKLWTHVSLRPEISGLHVGSLESLLALISIRFGPSLRYIELPIELITHTVLHELASKCPNLTHMLLDFSTAMQLHDFSEMQAFPTKLRYLCICLSEVIFMEGFMRKIYNFINGLEILHLIGTYEKVEEEEEEIYEVINVHKLKSATPNLRVINLYGINFVDDSHIDAFSSNCIQLECLAVNYCNKVTGSTMKTLFQRSRRLTCLLMNGCSLHSEYVMQVEWEKSSVQELDVTATDLSTECLIDMLTRIPNLRFLSAGQINGFNDSVLKAWLESGTARNLVALDVDASDNLTDEALHRFLSRHGSQLWGLVLSGMPHITDQLWQSVLQLLTNAK